MRSDLLQESLAWMDRGHLDVGFIIWTRHQVGFFKTFLLISDVPINQNY